MNVGQKFICRAKIIKSDAIESIRRSKIKKKLNPIIASDSPREIEYLYISNRIYFNNICVLYYKRYLIF